MESIPPDLEKGSQVIDLRFERGLMCFNVHLGSHRLDAFFDMGAGYCVLNARCFDGLEADLVEQSPEETTDSTGATARIPVYKHPALAVNGRNLGEIRFLLMDLTAIEKALGTMVDLIFGFNAMMNHNWIVDKPSQRLLLL